MKRTKLLLAFTMMLALIVCLFSVPVISGENPWDADGGSGGGSGSPLDSVLNDAGVINTAPIIQSPTEPSDPDDQLPGIFSQAMVKVSSFVLNYYYKWTSGSAQRNRLAL